MAYEIEFSEDAEGDQEICAIRSNEELLQYLSECEERARTRPRKTLKEIREQS